MPSDKIIIAKRLREFMSKLSPIEQLYNEQLGEQLSQLERILLNLPEGADLNNVVSYKRVFGRDLFFPWYIYFGKHPYESIALKDQDESYQLFFLLVFIDNEYIAKQEYMITLEEIGRFFAIFSNTEIAEQFIERFFEYTKTKLQTEALLELQAPDSPIAIKLIKSISAHLDVICAPEWRNVFRKLLAYADTAASFLIGIQATIDTSQPLEKQNLRLRQAIIDLFAQNEVNDTTELRAAKKIIERTWNNKLDSIIPILLQAIQGKTIEFKSAKEVQEMIQILLQIAKCSMPASFKPDDIKHLFELGVAPTEIQQLATLTPAASDKIMPNVVVQDDKYFICKMSHDDVRGPFLGLASGCCQALGYAGETAAQYGYTEPNSCFYVMFKGKPPAPPIDTKLLKTSDIVAQCWAWRLPADSDVIVFDSLEMSDANRAREPQAKQLFFKLAQTMVENQDATLDTSTVNTVLVGSSGTIQKVGLERQAQEYYLGTHYDIPTPTDIYTDADVQNLLYSHALSPVCFRETCQQMPDAAMLQQIADPNVLYGLWQSCFEHYSLNIEHELALLDRLTTEQLQLLHEDIRTASLSYIPIPSTNIYLTLFLIGSSNPRGKSEAFFLRFLKEFDFDPAKIMKAVPIGTESKYMSFNHIWIDIFKNYLQHLKKIDAKEFLPFIDILLNTRYLHSDMRSISSVVAVPHIASLANLLRSYPELIQNNFGEEPNGSLTTKPLVSRDTRIPPYSDFDPSAIIQAHNFFIIALLCHRSPDDKIGEDKLLMETLLSNPNATPEMLKLCEVPNCPCSFQKSKQSTPPLIRALKLGHIDRVIQIINWPKFDSELLMQQNSNNETLLDVAKKLRLEKVVDAIEKCAAYNELQASRDRHRPR